MTPYNPYARVKSKNYKNRDNLITELKNITTRSKNKSYKLKNLKSKNHKDKFTGNKNVNTCTRNKS